MSDDRLDRIKYEVELLQADPDAAIRLVSDILSGIVEELLHQRERLQRMGA